MGESTLISSVLSPTAWIEARQQTSVNGFPLSGWAKQTG
jgi:hypothetical protein